MDVFLFQDRIIDPSHEWWTGTWFEDMVIDPSSPPWGLEPNAYATLEFATGGDADWFEQDSVFLDTAPAWQSGAITHGQASWFQTTVTGPGVLVFNWKVSSEANYDKLRYFLDDTEQGNISGTVDWTSVSLSIPEGEHTVKWQYDKDGSVDSGEDVGWVDNIAYEAA